MKRLLLLSLSLAVFVGCGFDQRSIETKGQSSSIATADVAFQRYHCVVPPVSSWDKESGTSKEHAPGRITLVTHCSIHTPDSRFFPRYADDTVVKQSRCGGNLFRYRRNRCLSIGLWTRF